MVGSGLAALMAGRQKAFLERVTVRSGGGVVLGLGGEATPLRVVVEDVEREVFVFGVHAPVDGDMDREVR